MRENTRFGLVNVVFAVAFLVSVLVQYNDPDALPWMAIYGLAAAACIAFASGRLQAWQSTLLAVAALVWAAFLTPGFWGRVAVPDVLGSISMKSVAVELAREAGGLLLVAGWMIVLTLRTRRKAGVAAPTPEERP